MAEQTFNGLLFKQIHDRLEEQSNNALRSKDLTMMQVSILVKLHQSSEQRLSMKELERYFGVAQSTIVGIVSRLEQKAMVESFYDATDKRIKLVHITPIGERCRAEASYEMELAEKKMLRGFSGEERNTLNRLLTRVADNLK